MYSFLSNYLKCQSWPRSSRYSHKKPFSSKSRVCYQSQEEKESCSLWLRRVHLLHELCYVGWQKVHTDSISKSFMKLTFLWILQIFSDYFDDKSYSCPIDPHLLNFQSNKDKFPLHHAFWPLSVSNFQSFKHHFYPVFVNFRSSLVYFVHFESIINSFLVYFKLKSSNSSFLFNQSDPDFIYNLVSRFPFWQENSPFWKTIVVLIQCVLRWRGGITTHVR